MAIPWATTFSTPAAGTPVLLMEPNAVMSKDVKRLVRASRVESPAGAAMNDVSAVPPRESTELEFVCATREEFAFLRDFFRGRKGRRFGFWVPTWQWELNVADYFDPDIFHLSRVWLEPMGYAATYFPRGAQFRHMVWLYRDLYQFSVVTAAVADTPSPYELLELALPTGATLPPGFSFPLFTPWTESRGVRPLWLRYVRFDTDTFAPDGQSIDGDGAAVVRLPIVELPDEVA